MLGRCDQNIVLRVQKEKKLFWFFENILFGNASMPTLKLAH